jgi:hypothetical protein
MERFNEIDHNAITDTALAERMGMFRQFKKGKRLIESKKLEETHRKKIENQQAKEHLKTTEAMDRTLLDATTDADGRRLHALEQRERLQALEREIRRRVQADEQTTVDVEAYRLTGPHIHERTARGFLNEHDEELRQMKETELKERSERSTAVELDEWLIPAGDYAFDDGAVGLLPAAPTTTTSPDIPVPPLSDVMMSESPPSAMATGAGGGAPSSSSSSAKSSDGGHSAADTAAIRDLLGKSRVGKPAPKKLPAKPKPKPKAGADAPGFPFAASELPVWEGPSITNLTQNLLPRPQSNARIEGKQHQMGSASSNELRNTVVARVAIQEGQLGNPSRFPVVAGDKRRGRPSNQETVVDPTTGATRERLTRKVRTDRDVRRNQWYHDDDIIFYTETSKGQDKGVRIQPVTTTWAEFSKLGPGYVTETHYGRKVPFTRHDAGSKIATFIHLPGIRNNQWFRDTFNGGKLTKAQAERLSRLLTDKLPHRRVATVHAQADDVATRFAPVLQAEKDAKARRKALWEQRRQLLQRMEADELIRRDTAILVQEQLKREEDNDWTVDYTWWDEGFPDATDSPLPPMFATPTVEAPVSTPVAVAVAVPESSSTRIGEPPREVTYATTPRAFGAPLMAPRLPSPPLIPEISSSSAAAGIVTEPPKRSRVWSAADGIPKPRALPAPAPTVAVGAEATSAATTGGDIPVGTLARDLLDLPSDRQERIYSPIHEAMKRAGLHGRASVVRSPVPVIPTTTTEEDWWTESVRLLPELSTLHSSLKPYIKHDWTQWKRGHLTTAQFTNELRMRTQQTPDPSPAWALPK